LELGGNAIGLPERGTFVDDDALENLQLLKIAERKGDEPGGIDIKLPRGIVIH
jgi:hypothetical protein